MGTGLGWGICGATACSQDSSAHGEPTRNAQEGRLTRQPTHRGLSKALDQTRLCLYRTTQRCRIPLSVAPSHVDRTNRVQSRVGGEGFPLLAWTGIRAGLLVLCARRGRCAHAGHDGLLVCVSVRASELAEREERTDRGQGSRTVRSSCDAIKRVESCESSRVAVSCTPPELQSELVPVQV